MRKEQHNAFLTARELGKKMSATFMEEMTRIVKENGGEVKFKNVIDFNKYGWTMKGYALVWHDYHTWNEEKKCHDCYKYLCLYKKITDGIPSISGYAEEDNLYLLDWWAKAGNKNGLLNEVFEELVNSVGCK